MNKLLKTLALVACFSVVSQADVLRVEMGAGTWQQDISGTIDYKNLTPFEAEDLGYDKEMQPYLWLNFRHPIPILPNIRLEYTDIDFSGTSSSPIEYDNVRFLSGSKSTTQLTQYDLILYYNILDETAFTTFDIGLDVKYMDFNFDVKGQGQIIIPTSAAVAQKVSEDEQLIVPLLYARLRFDLPFDIGIESDVKYMKYKSSDITDARIKLDYVLVDILPIDVGLELGYRFENITINEDDISSFDVSTDIDVKGVFFGAVVKF